MIKVKVDTSGLNRKIARLAQVANQSRREATHEIARRFVRAAVDWTPPKGGKNTIGRRGLEQRITGDLVGRKGKNHGVFIGVVQAPKGKRRRERWPDLAQEITAHPMKPTDRTWRRTKAHPKRYVFKNKLNAALTKQKRKAGRQAAGWLSSAVFLGVSLPVWISRHGRGEGRIRVQEIKGRTVITMTNAVPYNQQVLQRLIVYAVRRTEYGLDTYIKKTIEANIRKAGS